MNVLAFVLVALNLRAAIVAVGPLTDAIRASTASSASAMSLLTTLPLLCLGGFAMLAPPAARRLGFERTILCAVALIVAGLLLRLAEPMAAVYAGSAVAGSGIAIANVAVPALIKVRYGDRLGAAMAIYSVAVQSGATVAAAVTVPLGWLLQTGWRATLALWAIPAVVAALAWLPQCRRDTRADDTANESGGDAPAGEPGGAGSAGEPGGDASAGAPVRVWRSGLGWACVAFIGLQSGIFFALTAWLPSLLVEHGTEPGRAALMVSVLGLAGIAGGLPMPLLATRMTGQGVLVVAVSVAFAAGLAGLLIDPAGLALPSAILAGLAQGGGLSLALTMFNLRSRTSLGAARLSGMAQAVGYAVAALAPLAVGVLRDLSGGWELPVALLLAVVVPMAVGGLLAARPRYVEDASA